MSPPSSPELQDPDARSLYHGPVTRDTTPPRSLRISISPPPSRARRSKHPHNEQDKGQKIRVEGPTPNLAAIEAGTCRINNHLAHFSSHLSRFVRVSPLASTSASNPRLPIAEWQDLYERNRHPHGHHFVIHQHDHPVAGVHYDLRLQINETSSISWAIMHGLPGNANSWRLNRNATETRVHCVWVGG